MNKKYAIQLFRVVFGTAEEDAAAAVLKAKEEAAKAPKTYTQEEYDKATAAQRYGYEKEMKKAAKEAQKLADDKRLSDEERAEHAKRAEDLQALYTTEKEQAAQREKKQREAHDKELKDERTKVETYKGKYAKTLIDNELAVVTADEATVGIIKKILRPDTVLVDELNEEGKPTGEQVVRVNFEDIDQKGKPVKLLISVPDAIKRMRELPEQYGSCFKGSGSSGLGGNNGRGGSGGMIEDTAAYIANRNKK